MPTTSSSVSSTSVTPGASRRAARAVAGVCAVTSCREDPAHRVRTLCSKRSQSARARQAGDLQLPGLHLHLRQNPFGEIPAYQEDPAGPHAGEAADDQTGDVAAHAPPDSPTGEMAGARRTRLLQLPRRADELSLTRGLPSRGR